MIRILFLAAHPIDQAHLRIRQVLDAAEHGRRFVWLREFSAEAGRFQELLLRYGRQISSI